MHAPQFLSRSRGTMASRIAVLFFLVSGVLAVVMGLLPLPGGADPVTLILLGSVDIVVAGLIWFLPWERWPTWASLPLLVPACAVIALFALVGRVPPYLYGTFYVLVFVWVGLSFRPWTSSIVSPFAAFGYLLPLAVLGEGREALASVLVVIPICVLVGETVAWTLKRFQRASEQAEERARALGRSERRLAEAQRAGRVGSWEWDLVGHHLRCSEELHRILGVEAGQNLNGEQLLQRVHRDDREAVTTRIQRAIADRGTFQLETRIIRFGGTERLVEVRGEVVTGSQGVPARLVGVMTDVSERRELERVKAELVGVVSHELRTPLTAIYGSLALLRDGEVGSLSGEVAELVELAATNADLLLRLLNDILDLERLESGPVQLEQAAADLGTLVEHGVAVMTPQAEAAAITLVAETTPVEVWADPDRIFQVLVNLLSNAIKFSDPGGLVQVEATRQTEHAEVKVIDQGRGIPLEHQERIFDRFQQVDRKDSREKGGTGLGLAICRTIIEQHGGRISVESQPGQGATFRFILPVRSKPAESQQEGRSLLSPERST